MSIAMAEAAGTEGAVPVGNCGPLQPGLRIADRRLHGADERA
jgi:hypothetical protein